MARPTSQASARRKKKSPSCATLRKRALKKRTARQRKAALKQLPARCKTPAKKKPGVPSVPVIPPSAAAPIFAPGGGTQPATPTPAPDPGPGTPDPVVPDPPPPPPGRLKTIDSPIGVFAGTFGRRQAERLLWRAGFGPRPGEAAQVAALDLEAAVLKLTRPTGTAQMTGPAATVSGQPIAPYSQWGHDHLWWMDRMIRSEHQLVERLALVFHDWFATSNDAVGTTYFMIGQSNLFRAHGLGNFRELVHAITQDPAMMLMLSQLENRKGEINENYARELMELFTLGADRGAYTETDVRELARALSGFRADWVDGVGFTNFRWDEMERWDPGVKTIFGQTDRWTWQDGCRLVLDHPMHPSFFVTKLWSYFVAEPPSQADLDALAERYVSSGMQIRPIVEAILCSPQFYDGPAMVKPPVVFAAGMVRAFNAGITTNAWEWLCTGAGQRLFYPPDVAGWNDEAWLDTSTTKGRWDLVQHALSGRRLTNPGWNSYQAETAQEAVDRALAFWGDPPLRDETKASLLTYSQGAIGPNASASTRAQRQNSLRQLIGICPDHQTA